MKTRLTVLGDEGYLLDDGKRRLLIDCGIAFKPHTDDTHPITRAMYQHKSVGPDFSFIQKGKRLHMVIVTHGHADHGAGVPLLAKHNLLADGAYVYGSPQTNAISQGHFLDSLNYDCIYNGFDVAEVMDRQRVLPLGEFNALWNFPMYINPAGHMPGSAMVIVKTPSGENVLFPGDLSFFDQPLVAAAEYLSESVPREWLPDTMFFDPFTLFAKPFNWQAEMERLITMRRENLDVPMFIATLQARGPNIALPLRDAGLNPAVDGGVRAMLQLFHGVSWSRLDRTFSLEGIRFIEAAERETFAEAHEPWLIIASAGMDDVGATAAYLPAIISNNHAILATTSYLPPDKKMSEIVRKNFLPSPQYVELGKDDPRMYEIRCRIINPNLSGHGHQEQALAFFQDLVGARGKKLNRLLIRKPDDREVPEDLDRFLRKSITKDLVWVHPGLVLEI